MFNCLYCVVWLFIFYNNKHTLHTETDPGGQIRWYDVILCSDVTAHLGGGPGGGSHHRDGRVRVCDPQSAPLSSSAGRSQWLPHPLLPPGLPSIWLPRISSWDAQHQRNTRCHQNTGRWPSGKIFCAILSLITSDNSCLHSSLFTLLLLNW